ncbi:hypothetical protein A0V43_16885 [Geobacillus sp. JS12]|nr:hypothetical protein A0V43_16885 [Geobacillus sp. JS12]
MPLISEKWQAEPLSIGVTRSGGVFYLSEVIHVYKLHEALSDKDKRKLRRMKKRDKMTWRDWIEIMGVNRPTYKRHRGAIKRK